MVKRSVYILFLFFSFFVKPFASAGAYDPKKIQCSSSAEIKNPILGKFQSCLKSVVTGGYKSGGDEYSCDNKVKFSYKKGFKYKDTGGLFDLPSAFLLKCYSHIEVNNLNNNYFERHLNYIFDFTESPENLGDLSLSCSYYFKDLIVEDLGPWRNYSLSSHKVERIISLVKYIQDFQEKKKLIPMFSYHWSYGYVANYAEDKNVYESKINCTYYD